MLPNSRLNRNNLPLIQPPLVHFIGNRITTEEAQRNLFSAIDFADENEFPSLCDAAISHGANVNTNNIFGRHPIVCAILRGSLPILRCLFARGALTPDPDQNGEDIVMIAAFKGHADIVKFLITDGNMLNDAKDIQGITALHLAVLHGHIETTKILLEHGSYPDTLTISMQASLLQKVFDRNLHEFDIFSHGKNITPLMIATALKDYATVNLLLKHHAKIYLGAVQPLLIAIKNDDVQMIELLSRAGAYADQLPLLNGATLLQYAIENHISGPCLQCLLNENSGEINLNSNQIYSLLAFSLQNNHLDYLAILLSAGMYVATEHEYKSLYAAASNSPNKSNILCMLASLNANSFEDKISSPNAVAFFNERKNNFTDFILNVTGVFPPAASIIKKNYFDIKEGDVDSTIEQKNFSLALELGKEDLLNKKLFSDDFLNHDGVSTVKKWLEAIEEKANRQFTLLRELSNKIINKKIMEFEKLMSVSFLIECIQSHKNPIEIGSALAKKFIIEIGLPNDLSKSLAINCRSGIEFILSTNCTNFQLDELALLAQKIITNLFSHSDIASAEGNSKTIFNFIKNLPAWQHENDHTLRQFYSDPVTVIRKLENRQGLRPAEITTLPKQLALHLGLPTQFCQYIVKAWSNSISKTNQLNNLTTTSAVNQSLKNQFSLCLLDELETMANDSSILKEKLLVHAYQQLKNWCNSQLPQAEMYSGKRHASDNDEPDPKRQRQQ
ncbi:MAG: hypothetical protein RIR02_214 [Pseudomonadota bacterium]